MRSKVWLSACVAVALAFPLGAAAQQEEGDPAVLALMAAANEQLRALGMGLSVEQVEFFTYGEGRPLNRAHQSGNRRVPGDPRRQADGNNITYLVDQSDGNTASGLPSADSEAAIDRALATWGADSCMSNAKLVKRVDTGEDPDVFDGLLGYGSVGTPFLADIVEGGWLPRPFFEALAPGGGRGIVAVTLTFTFNDPVTGEPTDINGDNFLDVAFTEVYYNDNFGDPNGDRPANKWGIDVALPRVDVETVAVHENGHSLELGHFGPPPAALMNPRYAGISQDLHPIDHAGLCSVWGSWPK